MRIVVFIPLILLAACKAPGGEFPSLLPRPNEAPREIPPADTGPVQLSDEERRSLLSDIAREESALARAQTDIAAARNSLAAALALARGSAAGSEPWVEAQLALSRFDTERVILGDIDNRLVPADAVATSLPVDDPDRKRLEILRRALTKAMEDSARTAASAKTVLSDA
ncbi:MAG: hypothetical protein WCZ66_07615 [Sphingomonadaceae bacterium]